MALRHLIFGSLATLTATAAVFADTQTHSSWANLSDPHLSVVPRTADEADRIAQVTRPTTDFATAQQFEERPAGAATVRVLPDASALWIAGPISSSLSTYSPWAP